MKNQLAKVVSRSRWGVRFRSLVNGRLFSLAQGDGQAFDFVELKRNIPDPDRSEMREIYTGDSVDALRYAVRKELTDA